MKKEKVHFKGGDDQEISAIIHFPADRKPNHFAIFAHCFTCNKNFNAVKNISLGLTKYGCAVLSFDFTGLGDSEGDFEDTNFSTNLSDLLKAAEFLKENYTAPTLLIGHSLGGAAVLMAASEIASVTAIATVGAPAKPEHVLHLIKGGIEEIRKNGEAEVSIGGRPFTIKQQFIEDLQRNKELNNLEELRKAILILHSPQDDVVSINNAREIYQKAHHPKSFISLDGADHLLSKKEDSVYAGEIISIWSKKYITSEKEERPSTESQTVAKIGNKEDNFTTQIVAEGHHLISDEPANIGGDNFGPSPYGLLTAALASCTAITLRMYANRKEWPLEEVEVHVDQEQRHDKDTENCDSDEGKITFFNRKIAIKGDLDQEQINRLLEIADNCPVHKTLESQIKITTEAFKEKL